jgi:hypothetical protein
MKTTLFALCSLGFGLAAFGNAQAQTTVLFNSGAPSTTATNAFKSVQYADSGSTDFSFAGAIFTPTQSGAANQITFAGEYYNNGIPTATLPTDNFTVYLYSTSSNAPTTLITSTTLSDLNRTSIGSSGGYTLFSYTATLNSALTLNLNTSYYLGIGDNTSEDFALLKSGTGTTNAGFSYWTPFGGFIPYSAPPVSFELGRSDILAVPEPSTWMLLLGGLGILSYGRLLRRRA